MIRAVLLDVDGTLVDSNDAHAWAWVDVFAEFRQDVPFERVRPLIGKGGDKLMPEQVKYLSDYSAGTTVRQGTLLVGSATLMPLVAVLLKPCTGLRVSVGIASSV